MSGSVSQQEYEAICHRATRWDSPAVASHDGDTALHLVLTFHGTVRDAGLLGAIDGYEDGLNYPLPWVLQAYRTLGLHRVATAVERAQRQHRDLTTGPDDQARWARAQQGIDASYDLDDAALGRAVRATITAAPGSFAPLG